MPTKTTRLRMLGMSGMDVIRRVWFLLLLLAAAACATAPLPSGTTQLTHLQSITDIRNAFNQDQGKTRIILLAAPT